ncbi:arsenic resistance protein [Heliorestis convoluta]|uniref:Arsenic resistance protein n=1 Tax=Heliorestis convoluta TaxID=356322 RepID=A0A5Q2N4U6_9FIRM|nr:arsenic resistance protein [Heliorestis convoluta]QGG48332.1 arsenic resistance protein [Heliorestis convoluta]
MGILEKLHTLIILLAVLAGLLLGQVGIIEANAENLIVPFLLLMLYGLFLTIPIKDLKKAFVNYRFAGVSLAINFIWTPLLAWVLGAIFLSDHPALWIGFIMLMVTPCTDWYLVFTGIARGNLSLSTAILPVNLTLQVLLLPVYLLLFAGIMEAVDMSILIESILLIIALPFLLANITRFLFYRAKKEKILEEKLLPFFSTGQIFFLSLAILFMFASQGRYLIENISMVYTILVPILVFFLINFIVSRIISPMFNFSYEDSASLTLTTLARNSPLALAIAVTAFPDQPIIALALIVGPLIELPLLTGISQILLRIRGNRNEPINESNIASEQRDPSE